MQVRSGSKTVHTLPCLQLSHCLQVLGSGLFCSALVQRKETAHLLPFKRTQHPCQAAHDCLLFQGIQRLLLGSSGNNRLTHTHTLEHIIKTNENKSFLKAWMFGIHPGGSLARRKSHLKPAGVSVSLPHLQGIALSQGDRVGLLVLGLL